MRKYFKNYFLKYVYYKEMCAIDEKPISSAAKILLSNLSHNLSTYRMHHFGTLSYL